MNIEHDKWIDCDNYKRYFPSSNEPHCYIYRDRALFVVKEEGGFIHLIKVCSYKKAKEIVHGYVTTKA